MMDRIFLILGLASFALPQGTYLSYIIAAASCIVFVFSSGNNFSTSRFLIGTTFFIAVSLLTISPSLATALLASVGISKKNRLYSLVILILNTSFSDTTVALISDKLALYQIEASAPSLVAAILLLFLIRKSLLIKTLTLLLIPTIAFCSKNLVINPSLIMALSALPLISLAIFATQNEGTQKLQVKEKVFLVFLVLGFSLSWLNTLPRLSNNAYFYLPEIKDSSEYKYYENYEAVIKFTGLNLTKANFLKEIPENSLVLLPWLTENPSESLKKELKILANQKSWTVLLIGEHSNMGGVAEFINDLSFYKLINSDLTTPPLNQDNSGYLRAGDISPWMPDSILNRGASVSINKITDKVLLSGDGWWAEKDIGEWLWVGDYIWQPADRNGRVNLASSISDGKSRWITLGDSSPFLNQVLLSDPRPAKMIIQMASLWPLFIKDIILLMVGFFSFIQLIKFRIVLLSIPIIYSVLVWYSSDKKSAWDSTYIGLSNFDIRNFNSQLSKSNFLLNIDWDLIRTNKPLKPKDLNRSKNSIVFGLIDNKLQLGSILLDDCHRLGNVKTEEGPLLMDAQACKVHGNAEVLIGDKNEAAAVLVKINNQQILIVLDQNYLSQSAPSENIKWLEEKIKNTKNEPLIN